MKREGMLSGYRVLDLTDSKGFLCGRALADLGADVIKIERPGGDPARSIGPFYHDLADPEKSLYWFAFNANKRGITLDIESPDGQQIFNKLVKTSDVVIESFDPGYMDKLGLGYPVLSRTNSQIILTSISGFGQEGPYHEHKNSNIVIWALSGMMYIVGDADRPPLMPSYPHSYLFGAMQAAIGTMIALYQRATTGQGQKVDASAQMSLVWATGPEVQGSWELFRQIFKRDGRMRVRTGTGIRTPIMWQCKDGHVGFFMLLGINFVKANNALVAWIESSGIDSGIMKGIDWEKFGWDEINEDAAKEINEILSKFFLKHTKMELFEGALQRGIQIVPACTAKETLEFPQLAARNYWTEIAHPELGTTITYPGGFIRATETDCQIRHRAPLIGEHNQEVYTKVLDFSKAELRALKKSKVI
jgi:crotonobetainyl-CoA:carnitine CoA-transferase CaiB-like acyl-CoA transferase